jgi:hypothetical protein
MSMTNSYDKELRLGLRVYSTTGERFVGATRKKYGNWFLKSGFSKFRSNSYSNRRVVLVKKIANRSGKRDFRVFFVEHTV